MQARYTLTIGNKAWSSWSLRPWLVLKMAKIPFAEKMVRLRTPTAAQDISKVSPSGKVPVLAITERGKTYRIWDTQAICETLAERHPRAKLWPSDKRARAHARAIVAEMHSGFPDVRNQLSMDVSRRWPTPDLSDATRQQIARIIKIWEGTLKEYGKRGGFLFGAFTIADAFYAPVVTRFDTYGIVLPKACQIYGERIMALPAMQEWIAAGKKEVL